MRKNGDGASWSGAELMGPARGRRSRQRSVLPAAPAAAAATTPTPAATTEAAASAATTAAAFAASTLGTRPSLADVHSSSLEVGAVQRCDRCVGFFLARHLDEAEALRLAAEFVLDDGC